MEILEIWRNLEIVARATKEETISVSGKTVSPLLPKQAHELYQFWKQGLSVLAFNADNEVIGHAAIEPLIESQNWYELGAVWVRRDHRGCGDHKHRHVGLRLYNSLLSRHEDKNILATTVNPAAMVVGYRARMVALPYRALPINVWQTTCCCPSSKTGTLQNVPYCQLRERSCFVRVTKQTWERLGCPAVSRLPIALPTDRPAIVGVNDGVNFVFP